VEGADFLLCEATLPEQYAGMAPHMTAGEAGTLAREAGASQLAMIHIWPTNDRAEQARVASKAFGRPAHVASELDTYEIVASQKAAIEAI
jgi:ribonuclease BN (tRNA processing enzyme)